MADIEPNGFYKKGFVAGQLHRIQQWVELIVGTSGRLIDLLTKHDIELDDVMTLVLDEVDYMFRKGFRDQVMQIFRAPSQPQVLMYSATIPQEVEKMASSMMKDIVVVSIGKRNRPNAAVKQLAIWVESKQNKQKLFDILMSKQHFMPPVVVFVVPVLVATGILGRGVDLLGMRHIIVFDMPNLIKEYVHQIGRASKLGEEGRAFVFVNEENKNVFPESVEILRSSGAAIPRELANSRNTVGSFFETLLGKGSRAKGRKDSIGEG
ncbi:hypothetical protein L1049_006546 [Liquidambar formosana]|uniref:RNA helicase n=1 Tax=Liquidambar formosana TaxID=63359 RepID=A0AAP0RH61_LIQFO